MIKMNMETKIVGLLNPRHYDLTITIQYDLLIYTESLILHRI